MGLKKHGITSETIKNMILGAGAVSYTHLSIPT